MRRNLHTRRGAWVAAAVACLCLLYSTEALAGSPISTNPADRPALLSAPIEDLHYDYGKQCLRNPQRGTLALQSWLQRHWRGVSWGIMRCEKLSPHNFSLHSEGRAIDWHLDAGIPAQHHAALRLIDMLLATDSDGNGAALARRMGVQGIIFNCHAWFGYGDRLEPYSYCYRRDGKLRKHLDRTQAHRNHVHIELNWAGALKRTSFWRSPLAP
jgi:hypothetical protein